MKEKKKVLLILGVFIAILSVVGVSYAAWQLTKVQSGTNVVTSGCFKVEFTDKNPISLTNTFPMKTEEGKALTPYEFTITNTCDSEANYQINLEILNDSTFTELGYIREMLNEKDSTSGSRILTRNKEVEKTLENASSAYKLNNGILAGKESKTFEFRLWMDQDTPAIESVMNKVFNSKITVTTSLKLPVDTTNMMVAMNFDESTMANTTYTQGDKYGSTLKKVIFESVKNPIEASIEVKDFSVNQDESVLGYYVENADQSEVELHIQADGKIKVNPNGTFYFSVRNGDSTYIFEGFENLDTSEVTNMSHMFDGMSNLTSLDLSSFDTSSVTNMSNMFSYCSSLTSLDLSGFDTSNVTNMSGMFSEMRGLTNLDLSHFDTSNVTSMSGMFEGMSSLTSLDISHFDTSKVTDMGYMFSDASSLTSLDLSHFDTSSVINMQYMFEGMSSLERLDLSRWNTSKVTDMGYMFSDASSLTSLDISNFDTSSVTDMGGLFGSTSLTSLDLSHFNTSNVIHMSGMFAYMEQLTSLNVSHFDTSNVTDMVFMFTMTKLTSLDLSSFDTSNVENSRAMFQGSANLTTITYGEKFVRKSGSVIDTMFQYCPANKPTHSSWSGVTW